MWADVLGSPTISLDDNFFELGGHSLAGARIINQLRSILQIELPMQTIFTTPRLADFAQIIEHHGQSIPQAIPRVSRSQPLPLSFSQERIWFMHQLFPNNQAYNAQAILRFTGDLDISVLEQSLAAIVQRYEIYRTTFPTIDDRPGQHIVATTPVQLPVIDLQHLPVEDRERACQQIIAQELHRPFQLDQLLLVRWIIFRYAPTYHVFLIVEHHFVHDGWSFNNFLRDLQHYYHAFYHQQAPTLAELPIQFADFASWQREWIHTDEARQQLAYWVNLLKDSAPLLELPTDRPRPAKPSFVGNAFRVDLPARLYTELQELSKEQHVSLFMLMLAVFYLLLQRYSDTNEIHVGSSVANRHRKEIEPLIGMIVNNIVIKTQVTSEISFTEFLAHVRTVTLEAYARQDMPFDRIVEALNLDRDLSYNPLFQTSFSFHDSPLEQLSFPNATVTLEEGISNGTAKFDLRVVGIPKYQSHHGLQSTGQIEPFTLIWEYATDLFDLPTIKRMSEQYQDLLGQVVADPQARLQQYRLISPAEERRLRVAGTALPCPTSPATLPQRFLTQAALTPDRIALVLDSHHLSFAALRQRATRLAATLQAAGVRPGEVVAFALDRSFDQITALLAILLAGAAYLPLDPATPPARLATLVQDCQPRLLLAPAAFAATLPALPVPVLALDRLPAPAAPFVLPVIPPAAPAYLLSTSGSTGTPKAVVISHANLAHLADALHAHIYAALPPAPLRVSLNGPLTFDTSVKQLIQLASGHTLVLIPEPVRHDAAAMVTYLQRTAIGVFDVTPSHLRSLLQAGLFTTPEPACAAVLVGGEAVGVDLWARGRQPGPTGWYNLYGPTECTVDTLTTPFATAGATPVLGAPLPHTQVYVLDRLGNLVPPGVPGELHIGGAGVGTGYHQRPALTAARFVPDGHSGQAGARLYATGDRVRWRQDGGLEYLGRMDQQVKVQGHRIELGEISAALRAVAGVVASAVEVEPGGAALVAYVVADGAALDGPGVRMALRAQLPSYMVPSEVVVVADLARTERGKIDWPRLRQGRMAGQRRARAYTDLEAQVAGIWAGVLEQAPQSPHDNFFRLGGHSLLATQVVMRLVETFRIEVPLRSIFEYPTVSELAAHIIHLHEQGVNPTPLQPAARDKPLPLSFAQKRLWFLHQLESSTSIYNISKAVNITGPLNYGALEESINLIVARHEALRTRFPAPGGEPVQDVA
ncbi:MAG TPA: amino acid adenylation domain-containing protein, partial [Prosthecobacter sp.]|nr:amino acid adenylation domain-containing protein [Prosthecobacter sp.]